MFITLYLFGRIKVMFFVQENKQKKNKTKEIKKINVNSQVKKLKM